MGCHWWTKRRRALLRELWPAPELSVRAIAARMGATRNAVIGKARRMMLGPKPEKIAPFTPAKELLVANLFFHDVPIRTIVAVTSIPVEKVCAVLAQYGLEPEREQVNSS